jgi:hypothetical protein
MKMWRYNRFECCEQRLPTKQKYCPICGKRAPYVRQVADDVGLLLNELDRVATMHEKSAATYKAKGDLNQAANHTASGLRWRRMFSIAHELSELVTRHTSLVTSP